MEKIAGPRIRRRTDGAPDGKTREIGYFQSAFLDGAGNFVGWDPNSIVRHTYTNNSEPRDKQITQDEVHPGPPYKVGGDFKSLRLRSMYDPNQVVRFMTLYNRRSAPSGGAAPLVSGIQYNRRYVGGFHPPPSSYFGLDSGFIQPEGPGLSLSSVLIPNITPWGDKVWNRTKPQLEEAALLNAGVEAYRDLPTQLRTTGRGFAETWDAIRPMSGQWRRSSTIDFGINQNQHLSEMLTRRSVAEDWRNAKRMAPKEAADQFLNVAFGWVPFINDLLSLDKVINFWHNFVVQKTKMNGVPVRKRVTLLDETTSSELASGFGCPNFPVSFPIDFFRKGPSWSLREEINTRVTGVGNFTYYRPEFDADLVTYNSQWSQAMRFLTITGLRISPRHLYNAIPWTWLIDWFTNLGDWIGYLGDLWQDQLVCHYCYCMQARRKMRTVITSLPFHDQPVQLGFSRVLESKERKGNTSPFGFGLSWDSLSSRQAAILAALGISKSKL